MHDPITYQSRFLGWPTLTICFPVGGVVFVCLQKPSHECNQKPRSFPIGYLSLQQCMNVTQGFLRRTSTFLATLCPTAQLCRTIPGMRSPLKTLGPPRHLFTDGWLRTHYWRIILVSSEHCLGIMCWPGGWCDLLQDLLQRVK